MGFLDISYYKLISRRSREIILLVKLWRAYRKSFRGLDPLVLVRTKVRAPAPLPHATKLEFLNPARELVLNIEYTVSVYLIFKINSYVVA